MTDLNSIRRPLPVSLFEDLARDEPMGSMPDPTPATAQTAVALARAVEMAAKTGLQVTFRDLDGKIAVVDEKMQEKIDRYLQPIGFGADGGTNMEGTVVMIGDICEPRRESQAVFAIDDEEGRPQCDDEEATPSP